MIRAFLFLPFVLGVEFRTTLTKDDLIKFDTEKPCPEEGYFFQRDIAVSPQKPRCFMCFCGVEGQVVCHERTLERCDTEKYHHHHHIKKRSIEFDIWSSLMDNLMEYSYIAAENLASKKKIKS